MQAGERRGGGCKQGYLPQTSRYNWGLAFQHCIALVACSLNVHVLRTDVQHRSSPSTEIHESHTKPGYGIRLREKEPIACFFQDFKKKKQRSNNRNQNASTHCTINRSISHGVVRL